MRTNRTIKHIKCPCLNCLIRNTCRQQVPAHTSFNANVALFSFAIEARDERVFLMQVLFFIWSITLLQTIGSKWREPWNYHSLTIKPKEADAAHAFLRQWCTFGRACSLPGLRLRSFLLLNQHFNSTMWSSVPKSCVKLLQITDKKATAAALISLFLTLQLFIQKVAALICKCV